MKKVLRFWRKITARQKIQLGLAVIVVLLAVFFGLKKLGVFADTTSNQISNTATLTYTESGTVKTVNSNTVVTSLSTTPTPTPTTTATSTPTPTPASGLTVQINLQGRSNYTLTGSKLTAYAAGTTTVAFSKTDVSTDALGNATVAVTGLNSGTKYDFVIKPTNFLSIKLTNQTYTNATMLDFGSLKAGDLNNDNIVNSLDFATLNGNWLKNTPAADINGDGIVNTIDFSLMNGNWLAAGQ